MLLLFFVGCKREHRENALKIYICSDVNQSKVKDTICHSRFNEMDYVSIGLCEKNEWIFFDMLLLGNSLSVVSCKRQSNYNTELCLEKRVLKQEAHAYEIMQCIINSTPSKLRNCAADTSLFNDKKESIRKVYFSYSGGGYEPLKQYKVEYYIDLSEPNNNNTEIKEFATKISIAAVLLKHYPSEEIL